PLASNLASVARIVDGVAAGTYDSYGAIWGTNQQIRLLAPGLGFQDHALSLCRGFLGGYEYAGTIEVDRGLPHAAYWASVSNSVQDLHQSNANGIDYTTSAALGLGTVSLFDLRIVGFGVNAVEPWQARALRSQFGLSAN